MKIVIPSEGKSLESEVNQSFGRTHCFIAVDSDTMEFSVIDNQAANSQGGAGIKAAQAVADSGADVVITFRCGQNAADVLKAAGIKIIRAVPGSVLNTVQKYKNGELGELTQIHPGYHRHGGSSR